MKTSDFGLATTLLTLGYKIEDVNSDNPNRIVFTFNCNAELEQDYFNRALTVDPFLFFNNLKYLRHKIYTVKHGTEL